MSNLYKVEHIICLNQGKFNNSTWVWAYIKDNNKKIINITVNKKECIEYINGEMHINIDKYNSFAEILKGNDEERIIWIGTYEDCNKYIDESGEGFSYLNVNEYMIKNLLE